MQILRSRMATPAGIEPATNSLEGCCSIQLSYGAVDRYKARPRKRGCRSVRPRVGAREGEIVRIGDLAPRWLLGREHAERNPVALAIGDRLLLGRSEEHTSELQSLFGISYAA